MTFYWWSHWFWITLVDNILYIIFVQSSPTQEISLINSNKSDVRNSSTLKINPLNPTLIWSTPPLKRKKINRSSSSIDLNQNWISEIFKESGANNLFGRKEGFNFYNNQSRLRENRDIGGSMRSTDGNDPSINQSNGTKLISRPDQFSKRQKQLKDGLEELARREKDRSLQEHKMLQTEMLVVSIKRGKNMEKRHEAITYGPLSEFEAKNNAPVTELLASQLQTVSYVRENKISTILSDPKIAFNLENVSTEDKSLRADNERKAKILFPEYNYVNRLRNFSSELKNKLTRSATISEDNYDLRDDVSSEALAIKRSESFIDIRTISVTCFTVFGVGCIAIIVGIVLYRRGFVNKPQTLSEPDSSVYIDDNTIRDNSDEMYSLDNDSFLNSLEAMTIQNYWTDTVKHTKL